jgi:hypothetical protein
MEVLEWTSKGEGPDAGLAAGTNVGSEPEGLGALAIGWNVGVDVSCETNVGPEFSAGMKVGSSFLFGTNVGIAPLYCQVPSCPPTTT